MKQNNIIETKILFQQYEKRILSERIKTGIRISKKGYDEKK